MKIQVLLLFFLFSFFSILNAQTLDKGKLLKSVEVYFDFGKHDLRPAADSALLELVREVAGLKVFEIKITAHTDSIGTLENNLALSQRRAQAVKNFLIANGVPTDKLIVSFLGETKPVKANGSDEGRQRNRRATVELFQKNLLAIIEGTVVDEKTGLPVVADLIFRTKERQDSSRTDATGYFKKTFPPGTVVGLDIFAECYFLKSEMVKAMPDLQPLKIELKPARAGEKMDIENLYFVGGLPTLLTESKAELPKILRFMKSSPSLKIEIAGHVNFPNRPPVVEESAEYKLSVARAKTVYDYLLSNGIAPDRITYKGYGNYEMRFPKAISEEQQAQNRRVEIRVLEGGCK